MPQMTGKRAFMEMLRAEGVKYIFGNPGTSVRVPFLDALEDYPRHRVRTHDPGGRGDGHGGCLRSLDTAACIREPYT